MPRCGFATKVKIFLEKSGNFETLATFAGLLDIDCRALLRHIRAAIKPAKKMAFHASYSERLAAAVMPNAAKDASAIYQNCRNRNSRREALASVGRLPLRLHLIQKRRWFDQFKSTQLSNPS
jgi:hypothetical protein